MQTSSSYLDSENSLDNILANSALVSQTPLDARSYNGGAEIRIYQDTSGIMSRVLAKSFGSEENAKQTSDDLKKIRESGINTPMVRQVGSLVECEYVHGIDLFRISRIANKALLRGFRSLHTAYGNQIACFLEKSVEKLRQTELESPTEPYQYRAKFSDCLLHLCEWFDIPEQIREQTETRANKKLARLEENATERFRDANPGNYVSDADSFFSGVFGTIPDLMPMLLQTYLDNFRQLSFLEIDPAKVTGDNPEGLTEDELYEVLYASTFLLAAEGKVDFDVVIFALNGSIHEVDFDSIDRMVFPGTDSIHAKRYNGRWSGVFYSDEEFKVPDGLEGINTFYWFLRFGVKSVQNDLKDSVEDYCAFMESEGSALKDVFERLDNPEWRGWLWDNDESLHYMCRERFVSSDDKNITFQGTMLMAEELGLEVNYSSLFKWKKLSRDVVSFYDLAEEYFAKACYASEKVDGREDLMPLMDRVLKGDFDVYRVVDESFHETLTQCFEIGVLPDYRDHWSHIHAHYNSLS